MPARAGWSWSGRSRRPRIPAQPRPHWRLDCESERVLYLVVMAACLAGTLPLEFWLRARVYARWGRWLLSLAPVLGVFLTWDALAIHAGDWSYRRLTGVRIGNLPIEELVFFLVIPTCSLLTLEAVRRLKPGWFDDPDRRDPGES